MDFLYKIYQILVFAPIAGMACVWAGLWQTISCIVTGFLKKHLPCSLGVLTRPDWWAKVNTNIWGKIIIRAALLPVEVKGTENIQPGTSYVFAANHQGSFDILLVCGYLNAEIRWMLKRSLEKMPFLGMGCKYAGYIFVDKGNPGKVRSTYRRAEEALKNGASLMIFPEGARTFTGHMGVFRRGAFTLADELQLPVLPITINGCFDVKPRDDKSIFLHHHKLSLTIHKPIYPESKGPENIKRLSDESYKVIMSAIEPKYQGFVENPDQ